MEESRCTDSQGSLVGVHETTAKVGSSRSIGSCVSFGRVQVQEHVMVLGDNPSTSSGPSVELDWEVQSNMTYETVEDYESHRDVRRGKDQLPMSHRKRVKLLLDNGCTFREIREATARNRKKAHALSRKQVSNVLRRFSMWKKDRVNERVRAREQRMQAILDSLDQSRH